MRVYLVKDGKALGDPHLPIQFSPRSDIDFTDEGDNVTHYCWAECQARVANTFAKSKTYLRVPEFSHIHG